MKNATLQHETASLLYQNDDLWQGDSSTRNDNSCCVDTSNEYDITLCTDKNHSKDAPQSRHHFFFFAHYIVKHNIHASNEQRQDIFKESSHYNIKCLAYVKHVSVLSSSFLMPSTNLGFADL